MNKNEYLAFSGIDPVMFTLGSVSVKWYGLMYLVGFIAALYLGFRRQEKTSWTKIQIVDLLFWCFVGIIIGGRLGYVVFYQFDFLLHNPLFLFQIWHGGMSFHGALIGVIGVIAWRSKVMNSDFLSITDYIAPLVPIGLGAGHIGNFINAELWGRPSSLPWAVIFPNAGGDPRHPSQLYEFALEGMILFIVLWVCSATTRKTGTVSALFLVCYGLFRFIVEFFRQPDAHIGLYKIGLTQGQLLCVPMIILGSAFFWALATNKNIQINPFIKR